MKYYLTVAGFALTGMLFGYLGGRSYCFDLLNRGLIFDESQHIPPAIADGSAYANQWAMWGCAIGLIVGIAAIIFWKVWWYRETVRLPASLTALLKRRS
jgi:hypothetical protein